MGQLHRFNSELYDQPTWRMCSSHIIFILAPNIFLCSHKSLFTFYVLLWPDTRNKIKWNWPQSPISRVARLWKISFLFQILLFFPMGSFYWYRQAWSLPTPRTQTTPSTRPGSPTVSSRVSFFYLIHARAQKYDWALITILLTGSPLPLSSSIDRVPYFHQ